MKEFFSIKKECQSLAEDASLIGNADKELKRFEAPRVVRKRAPEVRFLTSKLLSLRESLKLPIAWKNPSLLENIDMAP